MNNNISEEQQELEKQKLLEDRNTTYLLQTIKKNLPEGYIKAQGKGLVRVWAYYCYRCEYVWFPRDYSCTMAYLHVLEDVDDGRSESILNNDQPKACARCKSKYWNKLPYRKTKYVPDPDDISFGRQIESLAKKRADKREYIRLFIKKLKEAGKYEEYLESKDKEYKKRIYCELMKK